MLNLDIWTIVFQIINFLALAAALYYFLFRPVMHNVEKRAAEKEQLARELAQERQDVTRLRAELEARLAHADKEATAITTKARKQAEAERKTLLQETQTEVERILVEAHADAHRLRQQAVDESHNDLLDAILEISGWAVSRTAPPEVHETLVQQLCDRIWELGRSEMERVETFRRALGDRTPTAYVTSASPLSPEQQGLLARTFTALADRHVNLELKTDPSLAAGMQIRLGDMLVDNSIGGQLTELREAVSMALKERMAGE
ncbi:MAG: F0F1 ATP synthase subunit delta [Chloroflexota bacterium]|nr:F0F1 ATP synthase subunit delta [Chloroflexota bacterium]